MRSNRTVLLGIAFAAVAAPANAQDNLSWTGPYIGVTAGYGTQPSDAGESILFDTGLDGTFGDTVRTSAGANAFSPGFCPGMATTVLPADGCASDDDGAEFGVVVGYDQQLGSDVVVGVSASITRTDMTDAVSAFSTTPARYSMIRKQTLAADLRIRGGFAFGRTLAYASGGLAYGRFKTAFATSNTANSFTGNGNDAGIGYVIGAGLEHRISDTISLGFAYDYRRVDAGDYVVRAGPGTAGATNPFRIVNPNGTDFARSSSDFQSHALSATVRFRF